METAVAALFGPEVSAVEPGRAFAFCISVVSKLLQPRHSKNRVKPFAVDGHRLILI